METCQKMRCISVLSEHTKQKLIEPKGIIEKSTVWARDFSTVSILIEQVGKKINKDIEDFKVEAEGIFFNLFY